MAIRFSALANALVEEENVARLFQEEGDRGHKLDWRSEDDEDEGPDNIESTFVDSPPAIQWCFWNFYHRLSSKGVYNWLNRGRE